MAKQTLPTNYVDDVISASMGGKRRYNLIQNPDGTVSLEDATSYDRVGSEFAAGNINATNLAVNQSVDQANVLNTLEEIEANTDANKITGALATKELNSNLQPVVFWENPDPTTSFAPKSITLPSDDYSYLEIYIKSSSRETGVNSTKIQKSSIPKYSARVFSASWTGSGAFIMVRDIKFTSYTNLNVSYCNTSLGTTDNNYAIPLMIIGYK